MTRTRPASLRKAEAEINAWPNFKAEIGGLTVHFIVERGSGANPAPLIITHGWPGSIVEMLDLIDPLAHPERYGGDLRDAFSVVVPSMPGFGFSDPPPGPITPRDIAGMWQELMTEVLGFDRYLAQGGDLGSIVSSWLAVDHPRSVQAIHLNLAAMRAHFGEGSLPLQEEELVWLEALKKRTAGEVAYQQIQGTKPQTLAYGLTDSPVGLAAWILEKFQGWTIPGSEAPPPFPLDRLLTNVMLYWLGGINAANWLYCSLVEDRAGVLGAGERITRPTGVLFFPNDLLPPPPESRLRRSYEVTRYRVAASGGHFPALENTTLLVEDIRSYFRDHRA